MLESNPRRRLKVGLFALTLLVLMGVSILTIGRKQGLFVRHVSYSTRFVHVAGLVPGAPVWLNGVVVGSVDDVRLPEDPAQREISVVLRVDARVVGRVRDDSRTRLRTLGLLGDRYVEVTSGSPTATPIAPGGEIPSETMADLASVLAKGGDAMSNLVAVSASLRKILEQTENGQGILGQLVMGGQGTQTAAHLSSALEQLDVLLVDLRAGKGALGRLLRDDQLGERMVADLSGFAGAARQVAEALGRDLARDDTVASGLLRDPEGRRRLGAAIESVGEAAVAMRDVGVELREGKGALGRLIHDKAYAEVFLTDLARLSAALAAVAEKLDHGNGSASLMINDPQLYRDLENVVRGVEDSKVLGALVRNRRAAGERAAARETPAPVTPPSTPAPDPPNP